MLLLLPSRERLRAGEQPGCSQPGTASRRLCQMPQSPRRLHLRGCFVCFGGFLFSFYFFPPIKVLHGGHSVGLLPTSPRSLSNPGSGPTAVGTSCHPKPLLGTSPAPMPPCSSGQEGDGTACPRGALRGLAGSRVGWEKPRGAAWGREAHGAVSHLAFRPRGCVDHAARGGRMLCGP